MHFVSKLEMVYTFKYHLRHQSIQLFFKTRIAIQTPRYRIPLLLYLKKNLRIVNHKSAYNVETNPKKCFLEMV